MIHYTSKASVAPGISDMPLEWYWSATYPSKRFACGQENFGPFGPFASKRDAEDAANTHWAVAQTFPNKEKAAVPRLRAAGFTVVIPLVLGSRHVKGVREKQPHEIVVYPNYVFFTIVDSWREAMGVERDLDQKFKMNIPEGGYCPDPVTRRRGAPDTYVTRVIMAGVGEAMTPARVKPGFVDEIVKIMAEHDGYMPLAQARRFTSGQRVRVEEMCHMFYGLEGVYECRPGQDQARVLLDMLGRKVPVVLNERDLIAA